MRFRDFQARSREHDLRPAAIGLVRQALNQADRAGWYSRRR
jgi:hypothetical protein